MIDIHDLLSMYSGHEDGEKLFYNDVIGRIEEKSIVK